MTRPPVPPILGGGWATCGAWLHQGWGTGGRSQALALRRLPQRGLHIRCGDPAGCTRNGHSVQVDAGLFGHARGQWGDPRGRDRVSRHLLSGSVDARQDPANRRFLAITDQQRPQHPGCGRLHLDDDLVGLDIQEDLPLRNTITRRETPGDGGSFLHSQAQLGHNDIGRHSVSLRSNTAHLAQPGQCPGRSGSPQTPGGHCTAAGRLPWQPA